jgi:DNA-binding SARP family transcriptional activator/Flp pilus assembly protein TadD
MQRTSAEAGDAPCGDHASPRFRSRRTIGLLGYLAAERRPIARDYLRTLFWPDEEVSKGRANLRRELYNLSQILPGCWELDRQVVAFAPCDGFSVDIYALQQLEETKQWGEAVELLGGEFLEGLDLEDNLEYENWLLGERERWRERSQTILIHVIQGNIRRGRYTEALQQTQRQLQFAPWDETAHQGAMRLLAWTGQRGAAMRQFEACKRALKQELEVEPAPETIELYRQIKAGRLALPPQLPAFLSGEDARHAYEQAPFVGREPELEKLSHFLEEVLKGKNRVVFVSGGAGRGKTALLEAFSQQAMEEHPDLLVARGNCNAYSGVGDPYLPFRDIFAMLTGDLEARWDAGAITREHARRLWDVFPVVIEILLAEGSHLLDVFVPTEGIMARAVMAGEDQTPWMTKLKELINLEQAGMKDVAQSHLFQQVTDVLTHLANNQPLLLVLDDLQWGDTASTSLLFHLGRRFAELESSLMIVGAYRPEEVSIPRQGERHPLVQILAEFKRTFGDIWVDLGRLDKVADRDFVDALVDIEPNRLSDEFRAALFDRTGGHPLFTIELLRTMQARGELARDPDGTWTSEPALDWDVLPERVEAVIGERIDRLPPDLRDILAIASVEGEVFTAQVVAEVQDLPIRSVLRRLSHDLERQHRLVREQEEVEIGDKRAFRYKFNHILFQDYQYKNLSHGECRLLHGAVAGALENLYQDQPDEVAVQLAHHYHEGGEYERAFQHFARAGERAARFYESGEAIKHYSSAIDLTDRVAVDTTSLAKLHRGRGRAYDRLGEFERANSDHAMTLNLADGAGDQQVKWQGYLDLGRLWTSRDYSQARDYFESALALARSEEEPHLTGVSLNWMGNWYANGAEPANALEHHQEALEIFESLGDKRELANTLDLLALASMLGADLPKSVGYYDRAIPLYRELGDRPRLASSLIGRASTILSLVYHGSIAGIPYPKAVSDVNEGVRIAGELGLASEQAWGNYSLGFLNLIGGRFGSALDDILTGLNIATNIGHLEHEVGSRFALGKLYTELFAAEPARIQLEKGLNLARELRSQTWVDIISGGLAAVFTLEKDWNVAQACLDSAISADTPMNTLGRRSCWVRRAELALSIGDPVQALEIIEELIATTPSLSPGKVVAYLWMLKGRCLAVLGRTEEADRALITAVDKIQLTGERYLLWRIRGDISQLFQAAGRPAQAEAMMSSAKAEVEERAVSIPDEALAEGFSQGACEVLELEL